MTDYANLQTRCQRGETTLVDANNLLAECHAALGRLVAEVAGLRTGYQAYERVNAELKAELKKIDSDRKACWAEFKVQGRRLDELKAENEALCKRIDDLSPFKGAPMKGPDTKCLACGGHHSGLGGLPCPKMSPVAQALSMENQRITPVEPLLATHPLDAAMGKGEQS